MNQAKRPFLFKTQLSLPLLTGLKAGDVVQLRDCLKAVPESSVYYHTHHFLQEHEFLIPEPPNDFAHWVINVLGEVGLGEELMAVDTVRFCSLSALREAILVVLEEFLKKEPKSNKAPPGREFYFLKCVHFSFPTAYSARDLGEFAACLRKVSVHSLYYHVFEARLRKPAGVNDFSDWLGEMLGESELARKISRLDPYVHTLEGLRDRIVLLAEAALKEESHVNA